jgi:16S rRNA (cytidine1402-2'-O)-methyltransferase
MSTFYIVATPIGNLEDITFRALRVLKEVDLILCEDTRITRKLLDRYDIKTPTESYHTHSKISKIEKIIKMLEDGKDLALVSDAGTPTISDPGVLLVARIHESLEDKVKIIPIPGPSALVAALSASGIPSSDFLFLGFLPHKKGRETLFNEIALSKRTAVFYESPHRLMKTLELLNKHLKPDRKVVIARELTKIYEEFVRGNPQDVLEYFTKNNDKARGEFVIIISA